MTELGGVRRIAVVGAPGAGKSTVGRALAAATGLPLVHLDRHHWQPGWVPPEEARWRAEVDALVARPEWIIDGNYGGTLAPRIGRAELVVWLDLPTADCLWGVLRRVATHRGEVREDMADGCPERLDWTFLRYVLRFRRDGRRRIVAALAGYEGRRLHVRSRRERRRLMASLA